MKILYIFESFQLLYLRIFYKIPKEEIIIRERGSRFESYPPRFVLRKILFIFNYLKFFPISVSLRDIKKKVYFDDQFVIKVKKFILNYQENSNKESIVWNNRENKINKLILNFLSGENNFTKILEYIEPNTTAWNTFYNRNSNTIYRAYYYAKVNEYKSIFYKYFSLDIRDINMPFDITDELHRATNLNESITSLRFKWYISTIDKKFGLNWRSDKSTIIDIGAGRAYLSRMIFKTKEVPTFINVDSYPMLANQALELKAEFSDIKILFIDKNYNFENLYDDIKKFDVILLPYFLFDNLKNKNLKCFIFSTQIFSGLPNEVESYYLDFIKKSEMPFFIEGTRAGYYDLGYRWNMIHSGTSLYNTKYICGY